MIFACAIAATLPLALKGDSCGQDFDFHLQSWLAVAQHWRHGVFYPHWIEAANYGAGEPRLVFYPPFSWMLGALLGAILPWNAAPVAFTLIVLAGCGLSMYKLASAWLPSNAAAVAACAYILNPYALFVAYERTAYGELAAGIWLPLIVLYTLRSARNQGILVALGARERTSHASEASGDPDPSESVILSAAPGAQSKGGDPDTGESVILSGARSAQSKGGDPDPGKSVILSGARSAQSKGGDPDPGESVILSGARSAQPKDLRFSPAFTKPRGTIIPLALSIAAIWLTNAPAAVMASYMLAAIALSIAIQRRRWKALLPVATSFLLGLGLASFYLVPAAYERRWVDIARAIDPGMRIADSFLFEHTGESYHDQVLRTASWIFVAMLVAIAVAGWIAWMRRGKSRLMLPLFACAIVLLALQLPASSFLWNHAPELQFLQFPWRWSLVLSIVLAISLGAALTTPTGNQLQQSFAVQISLTLIAALAMTLAGTHLFWQPCDEEDAVSAQLALFRSGAGFEGTDEYTALGADNSLIQKGLPAVRVLKDPQAETAQPVESDTADQENLTYAASAQEQPPANISVETWQSETKSFTVATQTPGYAVLRLMDYPAWRVRINGTSINHRVHRDDGLMAIPIQIGTTRIEVTYAATPDVFWARSLSVMSLLALLALATAGRKRRTVS